MSEDRTPEGDPIEVHTMWLDFGDEGECAISMDLTKFNAAMRRVTKPRQPDFFTQALAEARSFDESMRAVRKVIEG